MNALLLSQISPESVLSKVLAAGGIVIVIFIFTAVWASRFCKVGPNEALIVSGRRVPYTGPDGVAQFRGFRIVKGGGTFILPVIEKVDRLSLELMKVDIATNGMKTSEGTRVEVTGNAQFKIKGDDVSIATAAEHFLSKSTDEIKMMVAQTLESCLQAILRTVKVGDISQGSEALVSKVQESAAKEMASMGLGLTGFTIRDIRITKSSVNTIIPQNL